MALNSLVSFYSCFFQMKLRQIEKEKRILQANTTQIKPINIHYHATTSRNREREGNVFASILLSADFFTLVRFSQATVYADHKVLILMLANYLT